MARRPTQSCTAGALLRKELTGAEGAERCTESTNRCGSVVLHDVGRFAQANCQSRASGVCHSCNGYCEPTSGKGLKPKRPSSVGSPMESATCTRHTAAVEYPLGTPEDCKIIDVYRRSARTACSLSAHQRSPLQLQAWSPWLPVQASAHFAFLMYSYKYQDKCLLRSVAKERVSTTHFPTKTLMTSTCKSSGQLASSWLNFIIKRCPRIDKCLIIPTARTRDQPEAETEGERCRMSARQGHCSTCRGCCNAGCKGSGLRESHCSNAVKYFLAVV